jgi:hypothetical protein
MLRWRICHPSQADELLDWCVENQADSGLRTVHELREEVRRRKEAANRKVVGAAGRAETVTFSIDKAPAERWSTITNADACRSAPRETDNVVGFPAARQDDVEHVHLDEVADELEQALNGRDVDGAPDSVPLDDSAAAGSVPRETDTAKVVDFPTAPEGAAQASWAENLAAVLRAVVFKAEYRGDWADWRTAARALALVVASVITRQGDADVEHAHRFFLHHLQRALDGGNVGGPGAY